MWNNNISIRRQFWRDILKDSGIKDKSEIETDVTSIFSKTMEVLKHAEEDMDHISSEKDKSDYSATISDDIFLIDEIKKSLGIFYNVLDHTFDQASERTDFSQGTSKELREIVSHQNLVQDQLVKMEKLKEVLQKQLSNIKKEKTVWYNLEKFLNLPEDIKSKPLLEFIKFTGMDERWHELLVKTGIKTGSDLILMLDESKIGNQHFEIRLAEYLDDFHLALKRSTKDAFEVCESKMSQFPNNTIWTYSFVNQLGNIAEIKNLTLEELNHLGLGTLRNIIDIINKIKSKKGDEILEKPWSEFFIDYLKTQTDQLQSIRDCTIENVSHFLEKQPVPADIKPWVDQICKFYDIRPYIVRSALKSSNLSDELILEILKARPLAFDPLPEKYYNIFEKCNYEDFNHIVSIAPHLYLLFPEKLRDLIFEEFRKNPEEIPQALDGLATYPLYWQHIFPRLEEELYEKFISKNQFLQLIINNPGFDKSFFKEQADSEKVKSFFRLGKDQWKMWIDPKYHHFGPEVFDLGLHGGSKEPGYLKRMLLGSIYLLGSKKPTNFHEYERQLVSLHSLCVEKGDSTIQFREESLATLAVNFISVGIPKKTVINFFDKSTGEREQIIKEFNNFILMFLKCGVQFIPPLDKLTKDNSSHFLDGELKLFINYITAGAKMELIEQCWTELEKIKVSNLSKEEKIRHFAKIHQQLERLHMFVDGNSRTNALLLQRDLVENGFSPAFFDPNDSYLESVDSWAKIIGVGIEKMEEEFPIKE